MAAVSKKGDVVVINTKVKGWSRNEMLSPHLLLPEWGLIGCCPDNRRTFSGAQRVHQ